jgi:hypothetical protein
MKRNMLTAYALVVLSLVSGQARAGGLLGATIHGVYYFPNTSTVFQDLGNKVVSPTAVFDFTDAGGITFIVSDSQIVTSGFNGGADSASFNGPLFTVVSGGAPIVGVTIDSATNVPGFDLSRVTFTSTSVSENVQGLIFPGNPNITLDLLFASTVPEPSTFILGSIAGVIGLMALRFSARHARRATAQTA